MRRTALLATGLLLATLAATTGCGVFDQPADIQVYSARHYDVEDAFAEFEEQTGKSVEFIFDDDAVLLERIKAEGEDSPADVYMTVDAGNLWNAADQGVLAPIDSPDPGRGRARGLPRPRGPLVRPRPPRADGALQPRRRRPERVRPRRHLPRPHRPEVGRAGSACATRRRPTRSPWWPR